MVTKNAEKTLQENQLHTNARLENGNLKRLALELAQNKTTKMPSVNFPNTTASILLPERAFGRLAHAERSD